jgi:hypothetical protein
LKLLLISSKIKRKEGNMANGKIQEGIDYQKDPLTGKDGLGSIQSNIAEKGLQELRNDTASMMADKSPTGYKEIRDLTGTGGIINTANQIVRDHTGKVWAYTGTSSTWVDNIGSGEVDGDWVRCSSEWLANILPNNAGSKNSRYRGKYLGTSYTAEQQQAVASGTFEGLEIGDYWTIGGVNWRIACFNYYLRTGDTTELTTNHITIIPDTALYSHVMNDTNTTVGGYVGSKMYTEGLNQAKTIINNAFPSRVLQHRQLLCNAVANDKANGFAWYDSEVELMNENMIYGGNVFGSSNLGGSSGFNAGLGKSQLPLFSFRPDLVSIRQIFWLRDVVSATYFARVGDDGGALAYVAYFAQGVRPAFSIY